MTANLYEKNERYHVMLNWYQGNKRIQKSISTKIPVQGNNKRKAEIARKEILQEWESKISEKYEDILFSDYLREWLETNKHALASTTYYEYKRVIEKRIAPYFKKIAVKMCDLKAYHIQSFYTELLEIHKVSANTVLHYHANIHKALNNAYILDMIDNNPASKVILPKKKRFIGDFYTTEEMKTLLGLVYDTKLEIPVILACWFGMRRGEVVGLKWDAINQESKKLFIYGTITDKGNKSQTENLTYNEYTKTNESVRAFPLNDKMLKYFSVLKTRQLNNKEVAGKSYNTQWDSFVCVDKVGNLVQPEYISYTFPVFLAKNGMRKIRYHDLRHSNASLLLDEGISLKEIQEWLGHKLLSTTADTYTHLQAKSKLKLTETIGNLLIENTANI